MSAIGRIQWLITIIPEIIPILEINPDHEIVQKLSNEKDKKILEDVSFLLFQQALLAEGGELKDPSDFVERLNRVMNRSL